MLQPDGRGWSQGELRCFQRVGRWGGWFVLPVSSLKWEFAGCPSSCLGWGWRGGVDSRLERDTCTGTSHALSIQQLLLNQRRDLSRGSSHCTYGLVLLGVAISRPDTPNVQRIAISITRRAVVATSCRCVAAWRVVDHHIVSARHPHDTQSPRSEHRRATTESSPAPVAHATTRTY